MNTFRIERHLRQRLGEMTDAELDATVQDFLYLLNEAAGLIADRAGKPFVEAAAAHIADQVQRNPAEMQRLKELVPSMPGLAFHLMPYFPDLPWLKDAASRPAVKPKRPTRDAYVTEELRKRDALEDRWNAIVAEIKETEFPRTKSLPFQLERRIECEPLRRCPPGTRTEELIAFAKFHASAHALGDTINPVGRHLREQRIDALAWWLVRLADRTAT